MKRGDVVTVILSSDLGKPRPAVVVQTDSMTESQLRTLLVCPITSFSSGPSIFRVPVEPTSTNGLKLQSEVMVDKISPASRQRIGDVIGTFDDVTMRRVERSMALALGFAG
ncbi:type II toxin-antitoxin system PemK/MazF family toxin [Rhizobium sp. AG855]|uniref:type II toxin-antitoxin system PemK/MazF family toxin n=1 Tax=Rhizobium sp. AG855 TaxID=2183898 RepID=UPI000E72F177|nr:type II toxin-antitoxin system PemK/MazF family toxin [Rhizobium sp. AG855]RKE83961.1 mRNA interferase MazF [Rhizobium sp. AG855]